jgi:hypothetical protein
MKIIWTLALLASLSACAARGVRCDERLQPINAPRAKVVVAAPATGGRP